MSFLRDIYQGFIELIYPPFCLICGKADSSTLCAKCIEKIDFIKPPICSKCGAPSEEYHCKKCKEREYHFEFARSAAIFDGILRDAILQFKYKFQASLAEPLAEIMSIEYKNSGIDSRIDLVVPVPTSRARLVERGFNQAGELAKRLCRSLALPFEPDVLIKIKETPHQANLPWEMREANVAGTFGIKNAAILQDKRILLIDDIITTGCTSNEAAKILKLAGASKVYAYTLARSI